tara:strand:- start:815 stop:1939 length:1125 start_codon:yes stop_codon:yes gene_type:complete
MKIKREKILIIYVEPTTYINALVKTMAKEDKYELDIYYLSFNKSQAWYSSSEAIKLLPNNLFKYLIFIIYKFSKNNYKLLHLAGWGEFKLIIALILAKIFRVPATLESDTPYKEKNISNLKSIKRALIYPIILSLPDFYLPGGSSQKKHLIKHGISKEKIIKANMTVDIEKIIIYISSLNSKKINTIKSQFKVSPNSKIILFVGRLEFNKGIDILINTFLDLNKEIEDLILIIVGEGSLNIDLKRKYYEYQNIIFPGRLSENYLLDLYAIAYLFVLPSRFEPWGLVINEAMASSLPVITSSNVGCNDDLVEEGVNGYIVNTDKKNLLKDKMEIIIKNKYLQKSMAKESLKKIKKWTIKNETLNIFTAWDKVLKH